MGWSRRTATGLITGAKAIVHTVIVLSTQTTDGVSIYDGRDTVSGDLIAELQGEGHVSTPFRFEPGLLCENGIYVSLDTAVTEVTIEWTPC